MGMGNRKLIERDASAQPLLTGRGRRGIQKGQDSSPAATTCEEGEKNGNVFDSMVVAVWYLRERAEPKSSFLLLPLSGRQSSWPTYRWERYHQPGLPVPAEVHIHCTMLPLFYSIVNHSVVVR